MEEEDYFKESNFELRYSFTEDISITINETPSLSSLPKSFSVTLHNSSDSGYMSLGFLLEKKMNDSWSMFPAPVGLDIGYYIDPNSDYQEKFYIQKYHEKMDAGLYRIVGLVSQASNEYDYSGSTQLITYEFSLE